jgi:hypothetical protein
MAKRASGGATTVPVGGWYDNDVRQAEIAAASCVVTVVRSHESCHVIGDGTNRNVVTGLLRAMR